MLLLTPATIGWPPRLVVKKLTGIEAKIVPDLKMRQRICTEAECDAETMATTPGSACDVSPPPRLSADVT
jgi:hypothetical protein